MSDKDLKTGEIPETWDVLKQVTWVGKAMQITQLHYSKAMNFDPTPYYIRPSIMADYDTYTHLLREEEIPMEPIILPNGGFQVLHINSTNDPRYAHYIQIQWGKIKITDTKEMRDQMTMDWFQMWMSERIFVSVNDASLSGTSVYEIILVKWKNKKVLIQPWISVYNISRNQAQEIISGVKTIEMVRHENIPTINSAPNNLWLVGDIDIGKTAERLEEFIPKRR